MSANMFGSSSSTTSVPLEHLDYKYIGNCTDIKELGKILRILNSGDEGYYPDLIKYCEKRIEEIEGPGSKYLRKDKPLTTPRDLDKDEWSQLDSGFKAWTNEMQEKDSSLKTNPATSADEALPPIRSGVTINTNTGEVTNNEERPFYQPSPDRIRSGEYRKWDKFDVDKEIEKLDEQESSNTPVNNTSAGNNKAPLIEDTIDATGLSSQERELKANREKDKGNEAFRANDYAEAEVYYSRSISLVPSPAAYNNRALTRIRQKKFKEALEDCNVVLALEPDNVKGYMRRGVAKKGLKDYNNAKKDFQHVLSLEPNNKKAKDLLAEIATEEAKQQKSSQNKKSSSGKRVMIQEVDGDSDDDEEEEDSGATGSDVSGTGNDVKENANKDSEVVDTVKFLPNGDIEKEQKVPNDNPDGNVLRTNVNSEKSADALLKEPEKNDSKLGDIWTEEDDEDVEMQEVPEYDDMQMREEVTGQDANAEGASQDEAKKAENQQGVEKVSSETTSEATENVANSQTDDNAKRSSENTKNVETRNSGIVENENVAVKEEAPQAVQPPPPLPDSVVFLKNHGNELYKAGQYGEAIERYSKAIGKLKPERALHAVNLSVLYSNRAACYSKTGDCRLCIQDCSEALDLYPQSSKPLMRRAMAYETLEKYRNAYTDYQTIFEMEPSNTVAQTGASRIARILQELDGLKWRDKLPKKTLGPTVSTSPPIMTTVAAPKVATETVTTKATKETPLMSAEASGSTPKVSSKLNKNMTKQEKFQIMKDEGNDKVKQGLYEEAITCYTDCIAVDDKQPVSYTNRALCYLKTNQPLKAETDCSTALGLEPDNIKAYFRRGQARKALQHYKDSLHDLSRLLQIQPSNSAAKKELEIVKDSWRKELREAQKESDKKETEKKASKKSAKKTTEKKQPQKTKTRNRLTIEEVNSSSSEVEEEPEPKQTQKKQKGKSKRKDSESETTTEANSSQTSSKSEKKSKDSKNTEQKKKTPQKSESTEHKQPDVKTEAIKITVQDKKGESKRPPSASKAEKKRKETKGPHTEGANAHQKDTHIADSQHKKDLITNGTMKQDSKITVLDGTEEKIKEVEPRVENKTSKGKKKGKGKSRAQSPPRQTADPVLSKATPYEFLHAWSSIKTKDTAVYAKVLKQVKPDDFPRVLSNKLEGDMLTMIVKSVAEHLVGKGEEDLGYQYLHQLCKAQRFQVVAMFLSDKDKKSVKSVISKLTARSSSVYSDRDLQELMESYGI
ncbi:sperm-associated antigen 1-like [Glandiceps talaboti]